MTDREQDEKERRSKHVNEPKRPLWPMLFWGTSFGTGDGMGMLIEVFFGAITGKLLNKEPKTFVRTDIDRARRVELAKLLAGGTELERYFGHANCRICGVELGSADMTGWGFMWPEKAEHYILEHDVWTPDCDRLLEAAKRT